MSYGEIRRAPSSGPSPCRRAPASRTSSSPESPPTGSAPRRTIFIPVYSFGLCEAVTAIAAVEPELADGEIEHLGADEPEVEHVGARVGGAAITAAAIAGAERRMSRPTAIRRGSNSST